MSSFKLTNNHLGLLDIKLFDATQPGEYPETELTEIYKQFQMVDYICGMRRIKMHTVDHYEGRGWQPGSHASLVELAEKAGDIYSPWGDKLSVL